MFQCEFCKKEYSTISSLNHHNQTTKFCINIQKEQSSTIINTEYTCDCCSKTFFRKFIYDKHLKKCSEIKKT